MKPLYKNFKTFLAGFTNLWTLLRQNTLFRSSGLTENPDLVSMTNVFIIFTEQQKYFPSLFLYPNVNAIFLVCKSWKLLGPYVV